MDRNRERGHMLRSRKNHPAIKNSTRLNRGRIDRFHYVNFGKLSFTALSDLDIAEGHSIKAKMQ